MDLSAFFDVKKKEEVEEKPKSGKRYPVGKYLVASFLYYQCDFSIMGDDEYDQICKQLFENFDDIDHPHKHLLDKEALKAGSGFQLRYNQYPLIVQSTAFSYLEYHRIGKNYFYEVVYNIPNS